MRFASLFALLLWAGLGLCLWTPAAAAPAPCPSGTQCVAYDALGRATSVITTDGKQTIYSYDAAGNRTIVVVSGTAQLPPSALDLGITYTYPSAAPTIDPRQTSTDTVIGVTEPQLGTTTFTASSVTYTPPPMHIAGSDRFGFEVQNSSGLTASAVVTVTLVNPAPIANPDSVSVGENGSAAFAAEELVTDIIESPEGQAIEAKVEQGIAGVGVGLGLESAHPSAPSLGGAPIPTVKVYTDAEVSAVQGEAVKAYQSGAAAELRVGSRVGDDLDIHHAPQAHVAEQVAPGYSRSQGPAIALPRAEHQAIQPARGQVSLSSRSMLAQEATNLRNLTSATTKDIQNWLALAKDYFGIK